MQLCIDTATKEANVSLLNEQKILGSLALGEFRYADEIFTHIDTLFTSAGAMPQDLTAVYTIVGPGSFTGLRVGVAVANQFAHQLGIPIIGLTTDEWWAHRTEESDYIYLQSLNRQEVYTPEGIKPIEEITRLSGKWTGQLRDEHMKDLHELHEIHELLTPAETWQKVVIAIKPAPNKKYDLLEPYYGKKPNITPSKKKLTI